MANQQEIKPQTIVIDNFNGALTRDNFGSLNSGLAKFYNSWGYNPFANPGNLTWNVEPIDYTQSISGLVIAGKVRLESGVQYLYAITNTGHFIKITASTGSVSDLHTLSTGSPTFTYGAALDFYNGKVWITNDKGISRIDFDGSNETQVGTWDGSHFIQNTYHALAIFIGKLFVGNTTDGNVTNFGTIDTTNTITTYSTVSPALQSGTYIRDMDVTSDFSYLTISTSEIPQESFTPGNDTSNSASGDSAKLKWNGTDLGITSGVSLPNFGITALNNFGDAEYAFMYDSIGVGLYNSGQKIITIQDAKSPLPNATAATGNLITWAAPEIERQLDPEGQTSLNSIYFYGRLDADSPVGLWRMLRQDSDLTNGSVNEIPFMAFTNNQYIVVNADGTLTQVFPIQYYSRQEFTTGSPTNQLFAFTYGVGANIDLDALAGATYETQTQMFSKKVVVKQIRVYCESTIADNGFDIDVIGSDGISLFSDGYSYVTGSDINLLQGSLNRINFNPTMAPDYGVGIRVTNTDAENMIINKIEVDIQESGK